MQLKDMIGYAELNEAFRHFKEFGNTIVFLNLLESALVRTVLILHSRHPPVECCATHSPGPLP